MHSVCLLNETYEDHAALLSPAAKYDQTMEYPQPIFAKAWELGLCNLAIPDRVWRRRAARPRLRDRL